MHQVDGRAATQISDSHTLWRFLVLLRQLCTVKQLVNEALSSGGGTLSIDLQRQIVAEALRDPCYHPDLDYHRRLLQALVRAAEAGQCELADELVEEFTQAQLGAGLGRAAEAPSWCTKTFTYGAAALPRPTPGSEPPCGGGSQAGTITLHVSRNMLEGATGCHEWSAGLRLAEYCLSNPARFEGKSCLELGCGTGILGVVLSHVMAARIQLTDGNSASIDNCRRNLAHNGVPAGSASCSASAHAVTSSQQVVAFQRSWEDDWSDVAPPDLLLGADIMYDPDSFTLLVALIKALLTPRPRQPERAPEGALLAGQVRNEATMRRFEEELLAQGLQAQRLQFQPVVGFLHLVRGEELADVNLYWVTI